jgi:hypothetical protein
MRERGEFTESVKATENENKDRIVISKERCISRRA